MCRDGKFTSEWNCVPTFVEIAFARWWGLNARGKVAGQLSVNPWGRSNQSLWVFLSQRKRVASQSQLEPNLLVALSESGFWALQSKSNSEQRWFPLRHNKQDRAHPLGSYVLGWLKMLFAILFICLLFPRFWVIRLISWELGVCQGKTLNRLPRIFLISFFFFLPVSPNYPVSSSQLWREEHQPGSQCTLAPANVFGHFYMFHILVDNINILSNVSANS